MARVSADVSAIAIQPKRDIRQYHGANAMKAGVRRVIPFLSIAVMAPIVITPTKAADPQLWAFCAGTQWVPMDQRLVACKAIIEASDETPGNQAAALCNRSIAFSMKGEVDLAVADITEALRLGLREYRGLMCRAYGYLYRGDPDAAIRYFDQAINLDAKAPEGFSARGSAHAMKKEYDSAIKDYTEAVQRNLKDTLALFNRGKVYLAVKDYDHAIADFDDVIKLDPTMRIAYTARASAFIGKGDISRANADLDEAKQIKQNGH
ncbi:tetratricopeptide repeat protein [Bradyrhizobium uaiense]|uniref:Tetratricopeptide repeat protein n=1 Tax=Bradyrhizobium uaiense TaxID=2594946 RepID=A0A6P1BTE8_9BRAD|nr:tetratricopeptide repeat protein [Bradyrhizobium uaiense]NEV01696.1 tetratricopeptide repeat protein [Bradyrhizobium uaiense]